MNTTSIYIDIYITDSNASINSESSCQCNSDPNHISIQASQFFEAGKKLRAREVVHST